MPSCTTTLPFPCQIYCDDGHSARLMHTHEMCDVRAELTFIDKVGSACARVGVNWRDGRVCINFERTHLSLTFFYTRLGGGGGGGVHCP